MPTIDNVNMNVQQVRNGVNCDKPTTIPFRLDAAQAECVRLDAKTDALQVYTDRRDEADVAELPLPAGW